MTDRTDKELCDVLVKADIARKKSSGVRNEPFYYRLGPTSPGLIPKSFVTDWRVAGACLERKDWKYAIEQGLETLIPFRSGHWINGLAVKVDNLPRAIIEAFCEAWEDENG